MEKKIRREKKEKREYIKQQKCNVLFRNNVSLITPLEDWILKYLEMIHYLLHRFGQVLDVLL